MRKFLKGSFLIAVLMVTSFLILTPQLALARTVVEEHIEGGKITRKYDDGGIETIQYASEEQRIAAEKFKEEYERDFKEKYILYEGELVSVDNNSVTIKKPTYSTPHASEYANYTGTITKQIAQDAEIYQKYPVHDTKLPYDTFDYFKEANDKIPDLTKHLKPDRRYHTTLRIKIDDDKADNVTFTDIGNVVERKLEPDKEFQSAHFILNKNYYLKNEYRQNMDAATFAQNDRIYVPFRYLAYALGVAEEDVTWDANTKAVTLALDNINEKFTVGSTTYNVNNQTKTMDVAPLAKAGRTYLPARFVAEAFGYTANYDGKTKTVTISKDGNTVPPQLGINADPTNPPVEYDVRGIYKFEIIKAETARKLFGDQLVLPENLTTKGGNIGTLINSRDVILNAKIINTYKFVPNTGTYLKNHLPVPVAERKGSYIGQNGQLTQKIKKYYPLKEILLLSGFPEQNIFWNPNTKTMVIYGCYNKGYDDFEYYRVMKITVGEETYPGSFEPAPLMENNSLLVTGFDYVRIIEELFCDRNHTYLITGYY